MRRSSAVLAAVLATAIGATSAPLTAQGPRQPSIDLVEGFLLAWIHADFAMASRALPSAGTAVLSSGKPSLLQPGGAPEFAIGIHPVRFHTLRASDTGPFRVTAECVRITVLELGKPKMAYRRVTATVDSGLIRSLEFTRRGAC